MKLRWSVALAVLALAAGASAAAEDEALYARLLERHTTPVEDLARTRVDYAAVSRDPDWSRLLESFAASDARELRSRKQKLAFWIDAYNVLAIDVVARHWPVDSIRDVGSLFRPVWKQPAGVVAGRTLSLDEIEHEIIRPLGDPRAHAAVVCASTSCPALSRQPFHATTLDAQLDAAMRAWMADSEKGLRIDRERSVVTLSKIFDWFEDDFAAAGGVLLFVARYAPEDARRWLERNADAATLRYFDYDWSVNAVR